MNKSLIYLTGFMGSGKSTVGPLLAEAWGLRFFDLDELIEKRLGKPISQIFKDEGEPFFRAVESEILRELAIQKNAVISLGGGTIINPDNMELVKSTGVLVYLYSEPEEIFNRVRDSEKRPLLETGAQGSLRDQEIYRRIELLLNVRQPFYQQADVFVDTTGKTVEEVVREIMIKLESWEIV